MQEARRWIQLVKELLEIKRIGYIGLLFHFYSGRVNEEAITIASTQTLDVSTLQEKDLLDWKEDVIYRIVK